METKPATTFPEQVKLLEGRGLIIDDENLCLAFLQNVNYYRFSAYLLPYRKDGMYKEGTSFHQVRRIYDFDARLRSLLFRIIEVIEIYLRTQFAYYFAHHYKPMGYVEADNYSERHNHEEFMKHVTRCINENRNTLIVKHHYLKYNGKLPIWVAIEFFSMGMLSRFYSDMKPQDRKELMRICGYYSVPVMLSWLKCLTELRNKCAHYSRLYFWNFISAPKIPKEKELGYNKVNPGCLFNQIVMLKEMCPSKSEWDLFKADLISLIDRYSNSIQLSHIGFPDDWISIL